MVLKKINGVHLDGHKHISIERPINEFLNPEFIYMPTVIGNMVYEQLVEIGQRVLKGQHILRRSGNFGHPIACPVSGTIVGTKKMWHSSGKLLEMLEIKNDFLEEVVEGFGVKNTLEVTPELIVERVKNAGIVGLGGAGFPTYVKYNPNNKIDVVLINAAECEPYITADYMVINESCEKLIKGIKYIMQAVGASSAKIAIKYNKEEAIAKLNEAIANEPAISVCLLKDEYPAGWEKYIVEKAIGKTYSTLPSEVGAVVNNVQTAIAVCDAVEYNIPLIEKVVTITGEGIAEPQNFRVKIGTNVQTLIEKCNGLVEGVGEHWIIAGGPMTGKTVMGQNLVISASLGSVIIKPKPASIKSEPCMGCGKCASHCPAYLTPTEIVHALEDNDVDALKDLCVTKCVQCGLCSYVCPSRIELTEKVCKAKELYFKMSRR